GQVLLDLKKSIDVQHISLHFSGYIEGCGDKVILINETILLAKPKDGKKYTTFKSGQQREFDFEFKIPLNKKLPSYFPSIPKIGTISYSLTATHKKPTFKLSHTLSSVTKNLQILDKINILEKGYCTRITKTNEIGFINDNKLAQWSLMISKSAFIRGKQTNKDMQHY
ncbi:uncharacterized protein BX663DRAFT_443473, partial [Cokeromyces recurvatus]|uniref:uncharacterized protein n=1 Tax=Cokeromyces recurvatus TaxID=90255 RepID=UPI0022209EF5